MNENEFSLLVKRVLIAVIVGFYLLSPLDLLPDVLFPAGFADDLGVLALGVKKMLSLSKE